MSQRANPAVIGGFVVGAIALAVAALVLFGGVHFFHRPIKVVMFFDESVNGLSVGAPVAYRGVKLGSVTAIRVEVGTTRIAVFAELEPKALAPRQAKGDVHQQLEIAVQQGLRAQLSQQSIVTGQLFVSLVILPDAEPVRVRHDPSLVEIPTIPTLFQQFVDRFEKIMAAIQDLPWERVFRTGVEVLEGARDIARSPELKRTLQAADAALADFQKLMAVTQREMGPLMASLRDTSEASRGVVTDVGKDLRQVLSETRPLIASLKDASDATGQGMRDVTDGVKQTLADLRPLVEKLEAAADAGRVALEKSQGLLGEADAAFDSQSGLGYQLIQALRELTAAARSVRALADYFEQHPDAIVFGRGRPAGR